LFDLLRLPTGFHAQSIFGCIALRFIALESQRQAQLPDISISVHLRSISRYAAQAMIKTSASLSNFFFYVLTSASP